MRSFVTVVAFALPLAGVTAAHAQPRQRLARANETYVLIEGPSAAVLEMQTGPEFRAVCSAPCDRPFPIGRTYRISGEDLHTSEAFELQGTTGSTTILHVEDTKHHTGSVVTQGGVLITLVGGLSLFGGVFGSCSENDLGGACSSYRWLTITGGALIAVGVATIVTGIVLMAQGSHAAIDQKPLEAPQPKGPRSDQAIFLPVEALHALTPAAATTPIFTLSF